MPGRCRRAARACDLLTKPPDYNTIMRKQRIGWFLLGLVLIGGIALTYLWSLPQVIEVYPAQGATSIPAGSALRLRFSRAMQADSVETRLVTDPPSSGSFSWEENTLVFTPDQPWPSGQVVHARLEAGAQANTFLPLPTRSDIEWSFSIGYPVLTYLYPADAPSDLYLLDPQTGEISQLTDTPGAVQDYSLNASGSLIVYNASRGDGGSTIYLLNRLSGETQVLLECPQALCRYPQISPDGGYLAYERTELIDPGQPDRPQVWLLPLEMSDSGEMLETEAPRLAGPSDHKTQQPLWSPAGLLSYYDYNRSEFVVQDTQGVEITGFPSQTGFTGTWQPQGEYYVIPEIYTNEIADTSILTDVVQVATSHLLRYGMDGSMKDLTEVDYVEDSTPAYSADGKVLAFGRKYMDIARWTPGRQVWTMRADGSQAAAITQEPYYNHYDLAWSPDGSRLAYIRFNKNSLIDPPELWMMNADGSGATRLVTGGYSPQWIP